MNDYHLDPPEEPELPQCPLPTCDGFADETFNVIENVNTMLVAKSEKIGLRCEECGHLWMMMNPWAEPDPSIYEEPPSLDELFGEENDVDHGALCPHDQPWGDCSACDYMSDMAFDAAREGRFSR